MHIWNPERPMAHFETGIRLKGVDVADKIWKTCCALHNWLLETDVLDKCWEQGVASDWE